MELLDKWIALHNLLWEDGGGVVTAENLFKAQEIVDNEILLATGSGAVEVRQALDGRILQIKRSEKKGVRRERS